MRTKLRSKVTLLFMTLGLLLAIPAIALADNLQDDIADNTTTPLALVKGDANSKATAEIRVIGNAAQQDPDPGCNFDTTSESLTISFNTPTGVTATALDGATTTAGQMKFTACGADQTVEFQASNAATAGNYTVTASVVTNTSGGTFNNQVSIPITISNPPDTTAPTSSASGTVPDGPADADPDPDPYTEGSWTNQNVTVSLSAQDNTGGSGVKEIRYTTSGTAPTATTGTVYSGPFTVSSTSTVKFLAVDNNGNVEDFKSFQVNIDKIAPAPNCGSADGAWHASDVTITCSPTDSGGSGLANSTTINLVTNVPAGTETNNALTNSQVISDVAGNTATAGPIGGNKVDKKAPGLVSNGATTPPDGDDDWYISAVTNGFTATDGGSGFAPNGDLTKSFTKSSTTEGSAVKIASGTVSDAVGNTAASIDSAAYKIDLSDPLADCDSVPTTWSASDVSIDCQGSDAVSGLANAADANFSLSTNVPAGTETANASTGTKTLTDAAGRSVTVGPITGIKVDKKAPVLTNDGPTPTLPNGTNGWYTSAVTNTFTATDGGSGFAPNGDLTKVLTPSSGTNEGSGVKIASGTVSDAVGNTAASIDSAAFNIDLSNPHSILFDGGPAAGESYDFGNVPTAPTCSAQDNVSGMPANGGCVVTGYSNAVGNHTMTATATDNAGRTATATRSYTVKGYTLSGFYQPIDMNDTVNTVKNGSTVPVKFELFQSISGTELTSTSAVTSILARPISCTVLNGEPEDPIETLATGSTSLRYDTTAGQFIYNWATPKGASQVGKCYSLTMTAADNSTTNNSTITAYFKLK